MEVYNTQTQGVIHLDLEMEEQKIKPSMGMQVAKSAAIALVILLFLAQPFPPALGIGTGTVLLQVKGYGAVHGQLESATIFENNSVTMIMTVNDRIQTAQGSFPIEATGNWDGVRNGLAMSGTISNVSGKIHVCTLVCSDADFVGQGSWSGQLDASLNGNGNFTGTITFTNSPYSQIPANQPVPTDGSWTASFAQAVPEFQWTGTIMLLVALIVVSIFVSGSRLHESRIWGPRDGVRASRRRPRAER
jgi:hypothetical protein